MLGLNTEIHMSESSFKFGYEFAPSSNPCDLCSKELMNLFVSCFILRVDCLGMLTLLWVFYLFNAAFETSQLFAITHLTPPQCLKFEPRKCF